MKNNEAMPVPAKEPERLDIEQEDVEKLMESFEEKQRLHGIHESIEETGRELTEKELRGANDFSYVKNEAAKFSQSVLDDHLEQAIHLLESDPSTAAMTLLKPVEERLQAKLDPEGGFGRTHENPNLQAAYDAMAKQLRVDAAQALGKALEARHDSLPEGDPNKARIGRLIGIVENGAPAKNEEIRPIADELEPEPAAPPKKKGFFQRLLGRK